MPADDTDLTPPVADERDELLIAARTGLNAIPVLGGSLAETLTLVIGSPLERRKDKWARDVAEAIVDLRTKRGIRLEDLLEDPNFIDTILSATAAAIRTSREEKREALRNAILNAGLPGAPDSVIQQVFVAAIDRLTERHLMLLKALQNPEVIRPRFTESWGGFQCTLDEALRIVYEPLIGPRNLVELIWAELQGLGFCSVSEPGVIRTQDAPKRVTKLGREFLTFIEDPLATERSR